MNPGFIYLLMLIASAACMMGLAVYSRRFHANPASIPYQLLMFCAAMWALLYAMDLSTTDFPMKIFWQETRYLFLPFIPVLELWMVLTFLKKETWISGLKLLSLCLIPCITVIMAFTSQYHTLFRFNYELIDTGLFIALKVSNGPFYYLNITYTYILIAVALFLLITTKNETHQTYQMQRILLFIALLFPVVIAFVFDMGMTPLRGVNLTPVFLWAPGILYVFALFRYKFLDIIPVARSKVIDEMGMPMIVLNGQGKIVDINPAADAILKKNGHVMIGKNLSDTDPQWPELLSFFSSINHGRQEITRNLGDTLQTYEARIDTIFSDSGSIEAKIILLTDISRQKILEQKLREDEQRWRSIVEGAPFPIVITRVSDNRILLVNSRTVEQFGVSDTEMVGQITEQFYVDIDMRNSLIELLKRQDSVDDIEMAMKSLDGRIFWVYASVRKIQYMGEVAYFISFADISSRKALENALLEKNADLEMVTQTLKATNKKLNLLSSITRHDILNNVQVILLMSELLNSNSMNADMIEKVGVLHTAGKNIHQLISFTAEYETLGQTKPKWQNISSITGDPLIIRLLTGVSAEIPSQQVEIFADPLLRKVFYNLIENSFRHGGDVKKIRISLVTSGKDLIVVYEDDGLGVRQEDKVAIFSRGFGKNTGLGLFFIKEILDITGMKITECGVPGEGARFEIWIPEGKFRLIKDSEYLE